MNRFITITALGAAVLFAATGCEKTAQQDQEKIAEAQREADQKTANALRESQTQITSAQLEANKQATQAQMDFAKLRDDYRGKMQSDFDALNKKIVKLETKDATATGKVKADLDAKLDDIHAKRDAWRASMTSLDGATIDTWDAARARSDKAWSDLDAAVSHASTF